MEALAFLHLAQDYEDPEVKEFCVLSGGFDWLRGLSSQSVDRAFSNVGAIALLSILSATWVASLSQVASAEIYSANIYDTAYVNATDYRYSRPDTVAYVYEPVMVRPDGDQFFSEQTCGCAANLCGGYRPVRPQPSYPDYRPVRPQPVNPGFLPVRPAVGVFLRRGDAGSDVRYVQDLLRSAGYFNGSATGFYATLTESSVKAFQRDQGLGIDGIVGAQTLAALENRV
jgi:murein L,D-transpeptidase YcbB/YkuD